MTYMTEKRAQKRHCSEDDGEGKGLTAAEGSAAALTVEITMETKLGIRYAERLKKCRYGRPSYRDYGYFG